MEYTVLPGTDLQISRLGLGCEALGGQDWGRVDQAAGSGAVRRALELGVNLFDTADVYGLGTSESRLSKALGAQRHDVVIVTKFGVCWRFEPGQPRAVTFTDCSPRRVVEALEESLKRLRIDRIPLYLIHRPDPGTPLAHTLDALRRCQAEGKVRWVGVSNFPGELIEEAHRGLPLAAAQNSLSLIDRAALKTALPTCRRLGLGVIAYAPLAQGLLSGKYGPRTKFGADDRRHRLPSFLPEQLQRTRRVIDELARVAREVGRTPTQVAIRWVLEEPAVSCVVAGAKDPAQMDENSASVGWTLTAEQRRDLSVAAEELDPHPPSRA